MGMKASRALICCALLAGCSGSGTSNPTEHVADAQKHHGVLGKYCSECHAPPAPRLHAKAEWPSVVSRMDMHRMEARLPALTASQHQEVLTYLQSHAEK
jgi:hypothetical protein